MPTVSSMTRLSLKNILFPTDFSPASRAALPFARVLAQTYGSTILLAHAIGAEPHSRFVTDRVPEEEELPWQHAQVELEALAHDAGLGAVPSKMLLGRGDVADVIPEMIAENKVDLVVLGTHGRRGVSKMILGSEAEKIYRAAICPVLVVGPKAEHTTEWSLRRILFPVDRAEDPEPALHYALSLAEEHKSKFILMEALPLVPWQHRENCERRSRQALERLIPEQSKDWCSPEYLVGWEHPVEAIVSVAQKREVDLIVMRVHRSRATSWSHLPWPVASEVIGQAPCPVLTIRV